MNKLSFSLFALLLSTVSCVNSSDHQNSSGNQYFDLKTYFENEIHRLNKENPRISKTVNDNGKLETKTVQDTLWFKELAVFINSNINKPAWNKSYKVDKTDSTELYSAIDSSLKTKSIFIKKKGDVIYEIKISNKTSNELYDLDEQLEYVPNNFYKIERKQKAKLLKESIFEISGKWLK